jgi:hypothetical protein
VDPILPQFAADGAVEYTQTVVGEWVDGEFRRTVQSREQAREQTRESVFVAD